MSRKRRSAERARARFIALATARVAGGDRATRSWRNLQGRARDASPERGLGRAQSHVVGAVILLGLTVLALGTLTASVGTVVESSASQADAVRVADGFESTLRPHGTGTHTGTIAFSDGQLRSVERDFRILNGSGVVAHERVDALRFVTGDRTRTVTFLGGAIVSRSTGGAHFEREPSVALSAAGSERVLVVGVVALSGGVSASATGGATVELGSTVSHERRVLGTDTFAVAVETDTPGPWERYFREVNASVDRRDFDGDGTESVVATLPQSRTGYLVVHRMEVRVDD